jgi:hypothetical protein
VYLDDFLIVAASKAECDRALAFLKALLKQLDIDVAEDKSSVESVQLLDFLGLSIDSLGGSLNIPGDKMVITMALLAITLACAQAGLPVPRRHLARVAGKAMWLNLVNPWSVPHTAGLARYDCKGGRRRWHNGIAMVNGQAAQACEWLLRAAGGTQEAGTGKWTAQEASATLTGERLLPLSSERARRIVHLQGDASGANRLAVSWGMAQLRVCLPDCGAVDIAVLEALSFCIALHYWGWAWPRGQLSVFCDNGSVSSWYNKGRAGRGDANDLVKFARARMREAVAGAQASHHNWLSRWALWSHDRAAAAPTLQAARIHLPLAEEITLRGTPEAFMKGWLPGMQWDAEAWKKQSKRAQQQQ